MFPPELRVVKIFIYLSVFANSNKNTADQSIYYALRRKYNILSSAVDIFIKSSYESQQRIVPNDTEVPIRTSYLIGKIKSLSQDTVKKSIDDYFMNKYNYSIQSSSADNVVSVRKIIYQIDKINYEGYIYEDSIFNSIDEVVCGKSDAKPIIDNKKIIYIIDPRSD